MEEKRKYLGTIGGGIAPLIPAIEKEGEEMEGAHALIDKPTIITGIDGLNPINAEQEDGGAHALVDEPHQIDNFPELRKRLARA